MHSPILIVARQEFLNGVRSKWFVVATVGLPLMMAFFTGLTYVFVSAQGDRTIRIVLVDESRAIADRLAEEFPEKFDTGEKKIEIDSVSINTLVDMEKVFEDLRQKVREREIDGYISLEKDFLDTGKASYFAIAVSNLDLNARLTRALSQLAQRSRLAEYGVADARARELLDPAYLETFKVTEEGFERGGLQTFLLVYFLGWVLYMTVIIYGSAIGRAILEEKLSRIVEVMLATIRPFQLLAGKVLGVGCVGLVQVSVWLLFGLVLLAARGLLFGEMGEVGEFLAEGPNVSPWLIPTFLVWFLIGYFFYALLYAAIAAIVGNEQEAQQFQVPITFLLLLPLISPTYIIQHPESFYAKVLSMIPFFSPIVMFMRSSVLMPHWTEFAASFTISGLSILGMLWLTARIYRIGILSYGKRPSLRELARWVISY